MEINGLRGNGARYNRWGESVNPATNWGIQKNKFTDYRRSFGRAAYTLADRKLFKLATEGKRAVILDLLSETAALRDIKNNIFYSGTIEGIAVGLSDKRPPYELTMDCNWGITHITGDLRHPTVLRQVKEQIGNEKFDLIIQRGWGALPKLPLNKIYYGAVFNWLFDNLSPEEGVMVVQTPETAALNYININMQAVVIPKLVQAGHGAWYEPDPTFSTEPLLNLGCFWLVKNNETNPFLQGNEQT